MQAYWSERLIELDKTAKEFSDYAAVLRPSPVSLLAYPIRLCSIKAQYSKQIPLPRASDDFIKIPTQPAAATVALSVARTEELELLPRPQSITDVAKEIYATSGVLGFYRGYLRSHVIDLIQAGLAEGAKRVALQVAERFPGDEKDATASLRGPDAAVVPGTVMSLLNSASEPPSVPNVQDFGFVMKEGGSDTAISRLRSARMRLRRFSCCGAYQSCAMWVRSKDGRGAMATLAGSLVSNALIYPLRTVNLRCHAYRPFDHKTMNFLQMTRCTIAYDGVRALYQGFGPHILAQILNDAGLIGQEAALAAVPDDQVAVRFMTSQLSQLVSALTSPLSDVAEIRQLTSTIPGLIPPSANAAMRDS